MREKCGQSFSNRLEEKSLALANYLVSQKLNLPEIGDRGLQAIKMGFGASVKRSVAVIDLRHCTEPSHRRMLKLIAVSLERLTTIVLGDSGTVEMVF